MGKQKEEAISNGKYVDPTFFGGQVEKGGDKCRKKAGNGFGDLIENPRTINPSLMGLVDVTILDWIIRLKVSKVKFLSLLL